jgi:hypothetical protein
MTILQQARLLRYECSCEPSSAPEVWCWLKRPVTLQRLA